jgi:H+/Na+-translocating ferredoxin:NAD+ oxidoreductase subunit G
MASPSVLKNPSGLRVVMTLTLVTGIAAMLLAVVDGLTREKIAEAQLAAKVAALRSLLPEFDGNPFQSGVELRLKADKPKDADKTSDTASDDEGELPIKLELNPDDADPAVCAKGAFCVYQARKGDTTVGYGIETWTKLGYSGLIKLLVIVDPEGTIIDVRTLEARETPGLGTKADEEPFRSQFKGKRLGSYGFAVTKDGGQVEAITSATITSRAYATAIADALVAFVVFKEVQQ